MGGIKQYLKTPEWRKQHRWRKAIFNAMNRLGLTGVHALPINRRWVEIHRRKMPLRGLDPALAGLKIVQVSDLHFSPVVWQRYLVQYVRFINDLKPDVVVVTGDLITGGYRYAQRVANILSHIQAKHGVICTFGNHDYSIYGKNAHPEGKRRADFLQQCLVKRGLTVLRNETLMLRVNGAEKPLAIVGLDDEWSGHINPDIAWRGVDPELPILCLNHNPANTHELMAFPWQWMLAGHTHGRQVATSRFGRRFYPKRFRHFTHGYYSVNGRHLYVNKGLSYGQRVQQWCRPEITVFKLVAAGAEDDAIINAIASAETVDTPPAPQDNGHEAPR
jgi:predicted MPP superfamily phosphohydrolase